MEKTSKELAVLEERERALLALTASTKTDIAHDEEQITMRETQLTSLLDEKNRLVQELAEAKEQLDLAQKQLTTRQEERENVEMQLRQQRRLLTEAETRQVQLKAHQRELTTRAETQQSSITTLNNSIEQSKGIFESLKDQKEKSSSSLEQLKRDLETLLNEQSEIDDEVRKQESIEKSFYQELAEIERLLSKNRAQFEVLEQAEMSMTGLADGAKNLVQALKAGKVKGSSKVISNLFDIPANLENAIGSVLGDQLDGIVMGTDVDPDEILKFLEGDSGRAILFLQSWIKSIDKLKGLTDSEVVGIAADLVKANDGNKTLVNLLLGQVVIVKTRESAKRLINSIPATGKIVTLAGEVFTGTGVIIAGNDKRASLVGRPRQKKELEISIDSLSAQKDDLDEKISKLHEKMTAMTQKTDTIRIEIKVKRGEVDRQESNFQAAIRAYDQQLQKSEWQKSQLTLVNSEVTKTKDELDAIGQQLEQGTTKIGTLTSEIQTLNMKLREVPLDEQQSQVSHWTTTVAVSSRGVAESERRYNEFSQTISSSKSALSALQSKLTAIGKQLEEVSIAKQGLMENEKKFNEEIAVLQQKIDPAEKEMQQLESEYASFQDSYTQTQQFEANQERGSTQAQLEMARTQENLESLRRKIEEDFGLVTLEYSDDITGPTPLPLEGIGELKALTEIPNGLEESINRQRALLRRMGAINPDAQKEFYEVKERYEFLSSQMEDLKKADADLRQIITELDDLMRKQFRTTFNAVAIEFKQLFTRLFGGGSARLILTDDENPTETGIDIEAKLPGRREQGLSLLSGGERSLTAVALIFSLLKVSPTPFCVMDEVDAMLDEANVGRFTELLKELSQDTQFIVITHNRNTVQVADVIYGVTMGRDSASQVISLRLDEVSDEMVRR